jgi:hypothetical protein
MYYRLGHLPQTRDIRLRWGYEAIQQGAREDYVDETEAVELIADYIDTDMDDAYEILMELNRVGALVPMKGRMS